MAPAGEARTRHSRAPALVMTILVVLVLIGAGVLAYTQRETIAGLFGGTGDEAAEVAQAPAPAPRASGKNTDRLTDGAPAETPPGAAAGPESGTATAEAPPAGSEPEPQADEADAPPQGEEDMIEGGEPPAEGPLPPGLEAPQA
ncbi:hypothetical protein E4O86_22970, partial [Rhizobiales bacterium L72]|nr:hypothetical protein [Propylenella binzhouense]